MIEIKYLYYKFALKQGDSCKNTLQSLDIFISDEFIKIITFLLRACATTESFLPV